jgi:hypothetical protein
MSKGLVAILAAEPANIEQSILLKKPMSFL